MITLVFGLMGASKTASIVREMKRNPSNRPTFTNIVTKGIPNVYLIKPEMIVKKELLGNKRDGTPVYQYTFNEEFWRKTVEKYGSINIYLDELHTLVDARTAMSKKNKIMNDFFAMIRRSLGQGEDGYGQFIGITQLDRRIDVVLRDMATQIRHCKMHYQKRCKSCGYVFAEHNEIAEPQWSCPSCGVRGKLHKENHVAEIWHFGSYPNYTSWKVFGAKTYHMHYFVNDIEQVFGNYDTLQWDSLFSDMK